MNFKKKSKIIKITVFLFLAFFSGKIVYADPWTENINTIYTTDPNKNVGIGTISPAHDLDVQASFGDTEPFIFTGYNGAWGEKDIFTIRDNDFIAASQDESSLLKVISSRSWSNDADGMTLMELTHSAVTPTAEDRQFYILGRSGNDEGQVSWGVAMNDADIWTQGSIHGGAVGTDCGGSGAACFSDPAFTLSNSGDITTTGSIAADNTICDINGCIGDEVATDDMGNHTASQNLNLNSNWLSGDGDDEGVYIDNSGNLTISGNVTTGGTVDGLTLSNLAGITSSEGSQLLNIDSSTISATQWGYLGGLDQNLTASSSPTFASPDFSGTLQVNTIDDYSGGTITLNDDTYIKNGNLTVKDGNQLYVNNSGNSAYVNMYHSGGHGYVTTNSGSLNLYGANDLTFEALSGYIRAARDNAISLGVSANRWADVRSVLINGSDIGFANGWKLREYPCTAADVQTQDDAWMQANANKGIQLLDESENTIAIFGYNGTLYVDDIKTLSEAATDL